MLHLHVAAAAWWRERCRSPLCLWMLKATWVLLTRNNLLGILDGGWRAGAQASQLQFEQSREVFISGISEVNKMVSRSNNVTTESRFKRLTMGVFREPSLQKLVLLQTQHFYQVFCLLWGEISAALEIKMTSQPWYLLCSNLIRLYSSRGSFC